MPKYGFGTRSSSGDADGQLARGQLIQVRVGDADVRDVRPDVRRLERRVRRQLPLDRHVPLLRRSPTQRAVDREHALAEARRRRRRDRRDARPALQHEGRRQVVERALRDGLQERKRRRRERRRDARPSRSTSGRSPSRGWSCPSAGRTPPRRGPKLSFFSGRTGLSPGYSSCCVCRLKTAVCPLISVDGKLSVYRSPGLNVRRSRHFPVVLDEVFLEVRALLDRRLLQIDRERLNLAEQEARERRARVGDVRLVAEQVAERERAGRRRRLDDVRAAPTASRAPS